ncbi:hypothetical protein BGW38_002524 [Lunasporangiospora selenospora]|uniref:Ubiquitin-like domain-containing protein n=1 Tax=Lunasporangiospora selenospora TaxID=979761 RepID=A0A9P6FRX9_9FUNG|nr:hypothetical protein BGW38_002524 [Lunasporangiospora selenospora]
MEAIISVFGASPTAITFDSESSPTLLDLKLRLADQYSIPVHEQRIQTAGGIPLSTGDDKDDSHILLFDRSNHGLDDDLASLNGPQQAQIRFFNLSLRLAGGKGGFGSMLRAQGGRMSSQKATNTDDCRDLSGRRIKAVKDAKKMAEYLQQEPERQRAKKENLKRKIEEKLEIADRPSRKHRFEDSKFFDEAEEQIEDVKDAVAAALKENLNGKTSKATTDFKGKGKAKADDKPLSKGKAPVKSLGMWDDMSDYESSDEEGEGDKDDDEQESEDEDEEEEDEDEATVPSVVPSRSSRSSSSKAKSTSSKAKDKAK